ncbi:MAG: protein kinase domain-containing protein [Solirubrobacterales bacterium]
MTTHSADGGRDSESQATRLDSSETTLDNTAETRVDGAAQPGYPPMGLPGDLTGRVEFVRVLSMHSSEADVLLVREVAGGTQRVVKFYRRPFENFDEDLFSRIQSATAENVVETIDAGWEVNDSSGATTRRRWELLEYCEGGTLAELIDQHPGGMPEDLVNDVVIEVGQALVELHAPPLEVAHRDLKPENIFIRTREPLDLALGDFGLSMALRATVIGGDLSRTIEYSAPEAAYGMVRREGDWYSFGLILVEMITGQHPFRSVDGQASIAQYIEYAKATKPIDLSAITSARFQQLCSGLLQHDADRRWGSAEFTRWINGEDVPVPEAETPVDLTARTECPFPDADGAEIAKHASPQTLAVAMAGNWNAASQMVGLTSGEFSWLAGPFREFLESTGNTDALAMVSGDHRDETMLTRLMSQLAPELPPVFRSRNISDSTAIAALANSARSDEAAAADLDALREGRVLKVFGRRKVEGTEFTYVELDQQWTDAYRRATQRNQESIEAGISLRPLDVEKLREMAKSMTLEVLVSERQRDSVAESIEQLGGSGVASSTGFAIEDDAAPHLHYADQIALMLVGTVLQVKSGETGGAEALPAKPTSNPQSSQQIGAASTGSASGANAIRAALDFTLSAAFFMLFVPILFCFMAADIDFFGGDFWGVGWVSAKTIFVAYAVGAGALMVGVAAFNAERRGATIDDGERERTPSAGLLFGIAIASFVPAVAIVYSLDWLFYLPPWASWYVFIVPGAILLVVASARFALRQINRDHPAVAVRFDAVIRVASVAVVAAIAGGMTLGMLSKKHDLLVASSSFLRDQTRSDFGGRCSVGPAKDLTAYRAWYYEMAICTKSDALRFERRGFTSSIVSRAWVSTLSSRARKQSSTRASICSDRGFFEGTWHKRSDPDDSLGKLLCFSRGSKSVILWSNDRLARAGALSSSRPRKQATRMWSKVGL